jgi:hypothetical protein
MSESRLAWIKPALEELNFAYTESGAYYPDELGTTGGPGS